MRSLLVLTIALLGVANGQASSTASANSVAMCPCVQTTQSCQKFDRRYQAHTIEDAIAGFYDPTLDRSTLPPEFVEDEDEFCETEECRNCRLFLQGKLTQVGLLAASPLEPFVTTDLTNKTCNKYRFATPEGLAEEQAESPFSSEESGSSEIDEVKKKKRSNRHHQRDKRQAGPPTTGTGAPVTDGSVIGTRYTISCTKGGASSDASGRVSLCSSCWVWRKLPANYAPQFVNELICDTTDTACLSGYASCSVGSHSIDVVRNDSGVLTNVALTAGSYCECKATLNSPLQSLITGKGAPVALPSIGNATKG